MEMKIYSRRRANFNNILVTKEADGWSLTNTDHLHEKADKKGSPTLFLILARDDVNYPESLGKHMQYLWDHFDDLGEGSAQRELNVLVEWMNELERRTPSTDFWRGFTQFGSA